MVSATQSMISLIPDFLLVNQALNIPLNLAVMFVNIKAFFLIHALQGFVVLSLSVPGLMVIVICYQNQE
jgi:hypothetical protein